MEFIANAFGVVALITAVGAFVWVFHPWIITGMLIYTFSYVFFSEDFR